MPRIHLTTPDGTALEFELTAQRSRVGRAEDNDIVISDGSVSSYHGEITLTDTGIHVHDRGSTNGTHVDGQRVEEADIPWGGNFRLGNCESFLIGDDGDAPEESADAGGGHEAHAESPSYGAGVVITGLGATPCPSSMRRGFGPKEKSKDSGGGIIMLLAVVALLACAAAAFMIMNMRA
jgi:Inner membrane component of T3SS, cytoplasmic domain